MTTGDDNDALYAPDFLGLFNLGPAVKLADHRQGPLTFEMLDELLEDLPRQQAAQHEAHMEFLLNQRRWQRVILPEMRKGVTPARLSRMIRDMKFGVPCPYEGAAYNYVAMYEAKLPRFTRLRRSLFENTIK